MVTKSDTDNDRIRETVEGYIAGVRSGTIIAGDLVKLVIARQVWDLSHRDDLRHTFDEEAACRVIRFFPAVLRHWKGEWAGQPFELSPWQQFILWCLFGWKRRDGTRRFRTGYVEIGRKNGKTAFVAGIGLYLLTADQEPAAEVYSAATKKDQARIIVTDAAMLSRQSPALKTRLICSPNLSGRNASAKFITNIAYPGGNSKMEVLSKDSETQDGLNPSAGLVDEVHAHKDRGLWDVLNSATGSRRQPLMLGITTAGIDAENIGGELHEKSAKVLEAFDKPDGVKDDTFFAFVAAASPKDDPYHPDTWRKANPNLGVSVKLEDLQASANHAREFVGARQEFFRKKLNLWTQAETAWLDLAKWDACKADFTLADLGGWECWGGMDLAAKIDLNALALIFRRDGRYRVLTWFWMPRDVAAERRRKDKIWEPWLDGGFVRTTPGAIADYDFIEAEIVRLAGETGMKEVACDPWNIGVIGVHLRDHHGIPVEEFRQGVASFNDPCREFERLISGGLIEHDGNPVLRWMISNVAVQTDAAGNIRPVKPEEKSGKKIDGVVAVIMALGRAIGGDQSGDLQDIPFAVVGV